MSDLQNKDQIRSNLKFSKIRSGEGKEYAVLEVPLSRMELKSFKPMYKVMHGQKIRILSQPRDGANAFRCDQ